MKLRRKDTLSHCSHYVISDFSNIQCLPSLCHWLVDIDNISDVHEAKHGHVLTLVWPLLGGSCPNGWCYYSGTESCFYVSTTQLDQAAARSRCQNMDADLASISDRAEMKFVNSISW